MAVRPARSQRRPRPAQDTSGRAPTAQRMIVGKMLGLLRVRAELNEKQAAEAIGYRYSSKISRLEGGQHDFKESEVCGLLRAYGATQDECEHVRHLAVKANRPGWWDDWSDVSTKSLQTHVSLEEMAQRIRSYEMQQLLGLLQIPEYTRALVEANSPDTDEKSVHRIVEFRTMRRERFLNASTAKLICLLDEVTLVRGYGTEECMLKQLDHLLKLAENPRIVFRLVPLDRLNTPVQVGTTTIFDFADGALSDIVYLERANGGRYIQDSTRVDEHAKGFDRLLSVSLTQQATVRRICHHRQKLAHRTA